MGAIIWRRKRRNQLLLLGVIAMGLYILFTREYILNHKRHLDDMNADLVTDEMEALYGDANNTTAKVTDQNVKRTMKYHRIWSKAHAVTTVKKLWPDTPDVDTVISALQDARIVHVGTVDLDDLESGTGEKWVLHLEGGQLAMMKIVWEPDIKGGMKEHGYCNYGFEMPWSEIAAFHLHRLFGFHNVPYTTGRIIDLEKEILPVAAPVVANRLSYNGSKICVTGMCWYNCKKQVVYCPENGLVEASIVYWVPHKLHLWTHPPQYMPYSSSRQGEWGKYGLNERDYCKKIKSGRPYNLLRYYHDLFDFAVMDTLMHHYDSKHYIVEDIRSKANGLTVRLDHGRAFCSHETDDIKNFLAPVRQCCTLRRETYMKLKSLQNGQLSNRLRVALANDPIAPILRDEWWEALDRRLKLILNIVDSCIIAVGGIEYFVVG